MKTFIVLMVIGSMCLASGGSFVGNGGDWFVRTLPLLKFQLPEDFGVVEGVQYKKVGLRRCTKTDLARLNTKNDIPDKINTIQLPDKNWNIYSVLLENAKYLVCSIGVIDSNPATALQTLVKNQDTDRVLYFETPEYGKQIKYNKSTGVFTKLAFKIPSIGTFLSSLDPQGAFVGYNLQDGLRVLGSPKSIYFRPEANPVDFVYIPLSIQDRDRAYFIQTVIDNSASPVWRVILPVAFSKNDFPLYALDAELRKSKGLGDIERAFQGIKIDSFQDESLVKFWAWSSFNKTPTSQKLRLDLAAKFGLYAQLLLDNPSYLEPKIRLKFLPSIVNGKLNHAAFQHENGKGQMMIPLISQTWRVGADIVHELSHALQDPCPSTCSVDRRFEMEMEAHLLERQHLKEMVQLAPITKIADDAFNYLVAASLPNVEWFDSLQKPIYKDLCEDVIDGYGFAWSEISDSNLNRFGCLKYKIKNKTFSRRRK